MKVKIQVVVESDQGETQILQEVTSIHRGCLQPENVGLTLAEAKTLLQKTQQVVVQQQIAEAEQQHASCQHCAQKRRHKDQRSIIYRTLFGIAVRNEIRTSYFAGRVTVSVFKTITYVLT